MFTSYFDVFPVQSDTHTHTRCVQGHTVRSGCRCGVRLWMSCCLSHKCFIVLMVNKFYFVFLFIWLLSVVFAFFPFTFNHALLLLAYVLLVYMNFLLVLGYFVLVYVNFLLVSGYFLVILCCRLVIFRYILCWGYKPPSLHNEFLFRY